MKLLLDASGGGTIGENLPGAVIVVIGESANRDQMKAFTPAYPYETTPWLSQEAEENNISLFPKAYANYPATVPSLEMYLTSRNQYNGQSVSEAVTILDVAKAAGYETHWISNQPQMGSGEMPNSVIAARADTDGWTKIPMGDDRQVLELLEEIPKEGSHFIVIHLAGSHTCYAERVPDAMPVPDIPGKTERERDYVRTILYTDQVLADIYTYARQHLHL